MDAAKFNKVANNVLERIDDLDMIADWMSKKIVETMPSHVLDWQDEDSYTTINAKIFTQVRDLCKNQHEAKYVHNNVWKNLRLWESKNANVNESR